MQTDLIVCAILNEEKTSFLLKNYKFNDPQTLSNDAGEIKFAKSNKSFWFPYKFKSNTQTLQEEINSLIEQLENEYTNSTSKTSSTSLKIKVNVIRIQSNSLLPIENHQKQFKINYFLCSLSNQASSSFSNLNLDTNPDLKWMSLPQMKQSLKSYKLMGLEPLLIFKKFVDSPVLQLNDIDIFYEPKMISALENQVDQTLLSSAKFTSNTLECLFELFYSHAFPSEYLNIVRFRSLIELVFKGLKEMQFSSATSGAMTSKFSNYFYSFDSQQKYLLNFNDFLLGFAAMEPQTQHGGTFYLKFTFSHRFNLNHDYVHDVSNDSLLHGKIFT